MCFFISGENEKNRFQDNNNIHAKTPIFDIERICEDSFFTKLYEIAATRIIKEY